MERRSECEIVEDLLFGYEDGVLNRESEKLVESHLVECPQCQSKLSEIKSDKDSSKNNTKKEIDYLKKIRIKNRVKSVLMALGILAIIWVGYYFHKFWIINSIGEKATKQFESENFYTEIITPIGFEGDSLSINKVWYKEGKYKKVSYIQKGGEIIRSFGTEYGDILNNPQEKYEVNELEKKATKVKLANIMQADKYDFTNIQNPIWPSYIKHYLKLRFGAAYYTKISTDHKEIGREYYVFELENSELWVDMETGLPIMSFGYDKVTEYYEGTKIPKKTADSVWEYHYDFGNVTDEDVEMPDLSEYKVDYFDNEKYLDDLLEE